MADVSWVQSNDNFLSASQDDLVWLILRMCSNTMFEETYQPVDAQKIPGWSGFHSLRFSESSTPTSIGYLPIIKADANEYSTINTVIKLSLKMANALGQSESVVTFDLAIYVKAKQLQMRYPDEFKNVVVRLGGFHIALNYLSLLGKMYSNSGLEDILIESGVYAPGTTTALMAGKSYNRGVRAHKLCLEALFRQMWKKFASWLEKTTPGLDETSKKVLELIKQCQDSENKEEYLSENWHSLKNGLSALVHQIQEFENEGRVKSKLFAFWSEYMSMVLILLQFIKAERNGNWNLHLASTAKMLPYFYAMDRVNYARWLPVYLADMHSLQEQHPEVYSEFIAGNHSVSRSQQPFCQVWSDMALEQSINCDSKSKGGLIGITQQEGAVDRWFLTSHERAAITRALKEMCGVENTKIGTHKETSVTRIKRDEKDVQRLVSCFTTGLVNNPFVVEDEDNADDTPLSNIVTGVVLPNKVADRLVSASEIGTTSMNDFIKTRLDTNEVCFWDPLKKLKIDTFKVTARKTSLKGTRGKVVTLNADRELFGRLLVVAKTRNINLKEILSYELSSVPFSLVHPDGTMRKTAKSALMPILERNVNSISILSVSELQTAVIIDAMALIQMVKSGGAATFGQMAGKYFDIITRVLSQNNCSRVDLVFDQYRETSIKAVERHERGESLSMEIKIHNENTPVPKQWRKFISNPKNKQNLSTFLCEFLRATLMTQLHPRQNVVLAGGFRDGREAVSCIRGNSSTVSSLFSDQEEADTRLVLHAKHASNTHQRVIVQSPDTDVAVLCVAHFQNITCRELWFKTGLKDKARFIPIHSIQPSLGPLLSKVLPAYHALPGCDTTSAFSGIGKTKSWSVLVSDPQAQQQLASLGEEPITQECQLKSCEAFVCSLYTTARKFAKTDDARHFLFCQKNKTSDNLPPTSGSLSHHIKRANFQAYVWNTALCPMQNLPSPDGLGWKLEDNALLPVLMTRNSAPEGIAELTTCGCEKSKCLRNCSCKSSNLPCTEACACMADNQKCSNPVSDVVESSDLESDDDDVDI